MERVGQIKGCVVLRGAGGCRWERHARKTGYQSVCFFHFLSAFFSCEEM